MTSLLKSQRPTWRDPPAYRGLLVWTLQLAIVRTTLQMNAGYLGCFTDCAGFVCNNRVLPVGPRDSEDQSVEWCFRNCLENVESISYKYAGLEYGDECFCGDNEDYGVQGQVDESQCQDRCTGNSDQICGDSERISIYRISDGVCSNDIGPPANGAHVITDPSSVSYNLDNFKFFGTLVDFSCDPGYTLHGASSIKCNETGDNNVTWSNLVPECIISSTTVAPYTPGYLGCYVDCVGVICGSGERVLSTGPIVSNPQSVEWCFRRCLDEESTSYKYAGLENRDECFFGNNEDYNRHGKMEDSDCAITCTGNDNQFCGDSKRISIYRILNGVCSNDIGPPANGAREITDPSSVSYNLNNFKFFGTRVHFSCDPGYTLHGASSIECSEISTNNVMWSDLVPTCEVPTTSANLTTLLTTYATTADTTISNTSVPLTSYTSDVGSGNNQTVGDLQTRATDRTSPKILPPTWESIRAPDGTNSAIAGKLGTGEIAGIAVGLLAALTVLIVAVAFLWRKRTRKTNDLTKETGIVLKTVGAQYENRVFSNHLSDTSTDTAQNQGDSDSAPPVYSQVIRKRPADEGDTAQNGQDDDESGWVDNVVYGCKSFPVEIEARNNNRDGQTNGQPPMADVEGKSGWVENIIYE